MIGAKLEDYPLIREFMRQKAVNFFLQSYLYTKPTDPNYKGLDRIEDLLEGQHYELAVVVANLIKQRRLNEAKGVFLRHQIPESVFAESRTELLSL